MDNGANAKHLAIEFHKLIDKNITPGSMAKTVKVFKNVLTRFTFDELEFALQYFIIDKQVGVYSPAFFNVDSVMYEAKIKCEEAKLNRERQKEHAIIAKTLDLKGDSSARNKKRASTTHTSSRRRKKYNFDMFE